MSLRAEIDVLLNLNCFNNINLYNQGHYYVKIRVYTETKYFRYIAEPVKVFTTYSKGRPRSNSRYERDDNKDYKSKQKIEKKSCYKTNGVNIKYIGETINLSETVYFKHSVDLPLWKSIKEAEELSVPLLLEANLYHADKEDIKSKEGVPTEEEYKFVNSKVYRLGDALNGIYKYLPIKFTNEYSSILETTVHCCIKDFSLRRNTMVEEVKERDYYIEFKSIEEQGQSDEWFLLPFSEHETQLDSEYTYPPVKILEYLVLSPTSRALSKITQEEENLAYRLLYDSLVTQYNILRKTYREIKVKLDYQSHSRTHAENIAKLFPEGGRRHKYHNTSIKTLDSNENLDGDIDENDVNNSDELAINLPQTITIFKRTKSILSEQATNFAMRRDNNSEDEFNISDEDSPHRRASTLEENQEYVGKIGLQYGIPNLNLDRGASKKPIVESEQALGEVIHQKERVRKDIRTLWNHYKSMLKYNSQIANDAFDMFRVRHTKFFRKLVLQRMLITK